MSGRSYTRARYGYEDDPNQRHPLLGGAGPTIASKSMAASGSASRNAEYDDVYKASDAQPSFWARTFMIGVVFFAIGAGIYVAEALFAAALRSTQGTDASRVACVQLSAVPHCTGISGSV